VPVDDGHLVDQRGDVVRGGLERPELLRVTIAEDADSRCLEIGPAEGRAPFERTFVGELEPIPAESERLLLGVRCFETRRAECVEIDRGNG